MALTSPSVSEIDLEGSVLTLFREFLAGYFDGAVHAIGGNANINFPNAVLTFQQSAIQQPLNGTAISVVWVRPNRTTYSWDTIGGVTQQRAKAYASLAFWMRSQLVDVGAGNAKHFAKITASLLFALLQNSKATQPLSQKGIHKLRPENPQLISQGSGSKPADPGYAMRMLSCQCQLRYPVLSQT